MMSAKVKREYVPCRMHAETGPFAIGFHIGLGRMAPPF